MYQYISCIRRILIPQNVLNILTTVLHSLPVNIVFISLVGKIDIGHVRLNFWDLGGQEELQSLWDKVRMWIMLGGGFCFLWDKVKYVEAILILYLSSLWKWDFVPCQAEGNLNNPYSKMPSVLWWCFCLFQYFAESHAVIYIVDSSDTERIDESKDAFGRCVYVVCQSCNCVFILSQTRNTVSFPLQKRWSPMPSYKESLCWFWPINRTYRLDDCDLLEFIQNNSGSTITSERNFKKNCCYLVL